MNGFFFSCATLAIARLVPELVPPISTSTPCWSNHSRALAAATSALFWWSATSTSTFLPATALPMSAIAMRMASAPAGPSMSAYSPDKSVMKPMRITSPETWACAGATDANMPAAASEHARAIFLSFMGTPVKAASDAEGLVQLVDSLRQFGLGERLDHLAVLHHEETVRQRGGESEILFDHEDGVALLAQGHHHLGELLHDHGREAFRDLVEQQQPGAGAQDARHRQHLLLAARQPRALARRALAQVGEHRVDLLD